MGASCGCSGLALSSLLLLSSRFAFFGFFVHTTHSHAHRTPQPTSAGISLILFGLQLVGLPVACIMGGSFSRMCGCSVFALGPGLSFVLGDWLACDGHCWVTACYGRITHFPQKHTPPELRLSPLGLGRLRRLSTSLWAFDRNRWADWFRLHTHTLASRSPPHRTHSGSSCRLGGGLIGRISTGLGHLCMGCGLSSIAWAVAYMSGVGRSGVGFSLELMRFSAGHRLYGR